LRSNNEGEFTLGEFNDLSKKLGIKRELYSLQFAAEWCTRKKEPNNYRSSENHAS